MTRSVRTAAVFALLALVASLLALLPVASASAARPAARELTISPAAPEAGTWFKISGRTPDGRRQRVGLEVRIGAEWSTIGTGRPAKHGWYNFKTMALDAGVKYTYRVVRQHVVLASKTVTPRSTPVVVTPPPPPPTTPPVVVPTEVPTVEPTPTPPTETPTDEPDPTIQPVIETETLPDAETGAPYTATVTLADRDEEGTWTTDDIPAWLTATVENTNDLVLTGTPPLSGTYGVPVQFTATEPGRASDSLMLSLESIAPTPEIATKTLPDGITGEPYRAEIHLTDETEAGYWTLDGDLPIGLGLVTGTNYGLALEGTSHSVGTYVFRLQYTADVTGKVSDWQEYTVSTAEDTLDPTEGDASFTEVVNNCDTDTPDRFLHSYAFRTTPPTTYPGTTFALNTIEVKSYYPADALVRLYNRGDVVDEETLTMLGYFRIRATNSSGARVRPLGGMDFVTLTNSKITDPISINDPDGVPNTGDETADDLMVRFTMDGSNARFIAGADPNITLSQVAYAGFQMVPTGLPSGISSRLNCSGADADGNWDPMTDVFLLDTIPGTLP